MIKFREMVTNEAVDSKEDKNTVKEFKKLLQKAYDYGYKNLESDWADRTVLYALDEVIGYTNQFKTK